ncbi:MAG TPA: hypothetical protein PKM41_03675 [Deltaproteobacteria bacterium]|nr:hypothetical protein [Deltaproteobacteria bacterium]HOI06523.1 hypothetical protein [Deltaproteobacteria bacterium]
MRITGKTAAFFLTFFLLLIAPAATRADVLVSVTGVGAMEGNNQAKNEQTALQDAFAKAALQVSLRYVPQSSIPDLVKILPEYLSSRGIQDIRQYQITSRSQTNGVLLLNVDVKMNEEPLKEWVTRRALSSPVPLRPRVLLMVTDAAGGKKTYEWWTDRAKSSYSPFEQQLASEMKHQGENVIDTPQISKIPRSEFLKPVDIARSLGADLLLTGTLSTVPIVNRLTETTLNISLMDVKSGAALSSWSLNHRSDLSASVMNSLMVTEIIGPVRALIGGRLISYTPISTRKTLCIEGIGSYATYQSIVNALKSMDTVSKLNVTGVYGGSHSICHALELRSSLTDVMENLRQKQVADADMLVEDDRAVIRILRQ